MDWRSTPGRAARPRKSQKVHQTSGSCDEAFFLRQEQTNYKKCKCSDANGRFKWANKPFYTNFITTLKLTYFMKHPVQIFATWLIITEYWPKIASFFLRFTPFWYFLEVSTLTASLIFYFYHFHHCSWLWTGFYGHCWSGLVKMD